MSTVAALLSSHDADGVWNLDPARSTFEFRNKTMWGLITVKGHFAEVRGEAQVTYTGAVSGRLAITAASLNTRNRKRDEHLRSADFFDVEKFSEISVVLTAANPYQGHQPPAAASRDRRRTRRRCGPGIGTDHCRPRAAGCEREPAGLGGCDNAPLGRARSRKVIGNETPSMFRPVPIVHSQDQLQLMG